MTPHRFEDQISSTREDDGVLSGQDLVHHQIRPEHARTRSQVQKMAHILQEAQTNANEFKIVFKPSFVFLITLASMRFKS